MKKKCIVIVGPTGVGKTRLSVFLAKKLYTEIISADSMQIYRGMDIGTAKVEKEYQKIIKHHMIDVVEPNQNFTVENFKNMTLDTIDKIISRNKVPILVGGTGLYINSITHKLEFKAIKSDNSLRNELELYAKENGNDALHNILADVDPKSADLIHKNNIRRVIRAIEVYKLTGKKFSDLNSDFNNYNNDFDFYIIGLTDKRENLYKRINDRVDFMIDSGFLAECKKIYEITDENSQSIQAIGYKEGIMYLKNQITYPKMIDLMKQNSRKYCKRQLTWFKNDKRINWINISDFKDFEDIENNILLEVKEWLYDGKIN